MAVGGESLVGVHGCSGGAGNMLKARPVNRAELRAWVASITMTACVACVSWHDSVTVCDCLEVLVPDMHVP
jgi:hypothetical protein